MSGDIDLGKSAENGKTAAAELLQLARQRPDPVDPAAPNLAGRELDGDHRSTPRAVRPAGPRWETRYAWAVAGTDLAATVLSLGLRELWGPPSTIDQLQMILGLAVLTLTITVLGLTRAWDPSILGHGSEEFSRLLRAHATVAVVVGLVGLALKWPEVRPWVFGVVPLAFLLAGVGRLILRKALHRRRRKGGCMHQVLAVGTEVAVTELIVRARRASHYGWEVTAACTPSGTGTEGGDNILGVPVVSDLDSVADVVRHHKHHVVSVAQTPGWTSKRLHNLAWDLEGTGAELVVDPGLMEIAGPRLHVAAVDGLPLLRLTEPAFTGVPRAVKAIGDRLAAALLLLLLAPVMLGLAIAVRNDGGPIFYRQYRVGKNGKHFAMIKFRSMVVDADKRRDELVKANEAAGPLFKIRHDPRVTRVGAVLRKYSLDELPQLFNVVAGSMSLVGPRPPLPEEVATYHRDAQRKLLVKPGLTGLWQISGRSDLSWEESVRLDLRYVENWSLALDFLIVWKTVGTVLRGTGAY